MERDPATETEQAQAAELLGGSRDPGGVRGDFVAVLEQSMKTLKATLMITRTHGRDDDKPMHVIVTDEISGCRVLELNMEMAEFCKALTSSNGEAEMEYYDSAAIGMKAETKTEVIPFDCFERNESEIDNVLRQWEVDGWKARRSDMTNHHRRAKDGQSVVFFRHVNPETGKPV